MNEKGRRLDPTGLAPITEMPAPTDKTWLQTVCFSEFLLRFPSKYE